LPAEKPFPTELPDVGSPLAHRAPKTQIVYLTIVLSILICLALLPYLSVDVSVTSPGFLRASAEHATLKSTSTGIIRRVRVKENEVVLAGQLLFEVRSPVLEEKILFLEGKVAEGNKVLNDVRKLIDRVMADPSNAPLVYATGSLVTPLYNQSFADYSKKKAERQTRLLKVKQDYDRNKKLYDQQVISQVEYEGFKFELDNAIGDLDLHKESQLSAWQQERRGFEKEAADYRTQLSQAQWEKENLNIRAPIKGTVQNIAGIYPGSPVFVNQSLAEISPDTDLIAEISVSPGDIGLLREGMEVRMHIDAFNYNQWGALTGKISEISNDVQLVRDQPIFEVTCALDQDYLKLKNGYQGKFKKGMTLQARFKVAKRSLWQLLYDKLDDWVNPNIKNPS
jgi:HlyD family secretion protein